MFVLVRVTVKAPTNITYWYSRQCECSLNLLSHHITCHYDPAADHHNTSHMSCLLDKYKVYFCLASELVLNCTAN